MNHCTHEQSKALKEIGFDMPVRDYYIGNDIKLGTTLVNWNNNLTSAPTHAEVLEWFREKNKIRGAVLHNDGNGGYKYEVFKWNYDNNIGKWKRLHPINSYLNYKDALFDLINKCIEILN